MSRVIIREEEGLLEDGRQEYLYLYEQYRDSESTIQSILPVLYE